MKGRIYAVAWTWMKSRIVATKREGNDRMRVWKKWYERQGWKVLRSGPEAYIATHPDTGERHSIVFHEYDEETHERIWSPPKSRRKIEEKTNVVPIRRGRKPIGA
jgi:hypothetical protein